MKALPTEFRIGTSRSSFPEEEVAGSVRRTGSNTSCSESLVRPSGRTKRHRWKSHGGRRGRRQRQLFRNLCLDRIQAKPKKIESPLSTTSDSSPLRDNEFRVSGKDVGRAGSDHPYTNALRSISRDALLAARPDRTHSDEIGGCCLGPENVWAVSAFVFSHHDCFSCVNLCSPAPLWCRELQHRSSFPPSAGIFQANFHALKSVTRLMNTLGPERPSDSQPASLAQYQFHFSSSFWFSHKTKGWFPSLGSVSHDQRTRRHHSCAVSKTCIVVEHRFPTTAFQRYGTLGQSWLFFFFEQRDSLSPGQKQYLLSVAST